MESVGLKPNRNGIAVMRSWGEVSVGIGSQFINRIGAAAIEIGSTETVVIRPGIGLVTPAIVNSPDQLVMSSMR
jgi:hypothetical protein